MEDAAQNRAMPGPVVPGAAVPGPVLGPVPAVPGLHRQSAPEPRRRSEAAPDHDGSTTTASGAAVPAPQQQRYQVRFDWAEAGVRRIGEGAHIVVIADELDGHGLQARGVRAEALAAVADPTQAVISVTEASVGDAATRILTLQETLGDRAVVAVVAAGSLDPDGLRFCVEDLLTAGAVVDALASAGLDFASPEAAAACAAYVGLRRATAHLATATVSGAVGGQDARLERDGHPPVVEVLREFRPRA